MVLCLIRCFSAFSQSSGVVEVYYDSSSRLPVWGFSHYQPLQDTTIIWSSYTWYWDRQLDSKHWIQYWVTNKIGVGTEIEFYKNDLFYVIPRLGIQVRLWWYMNKRTTHVTDIRDRHTRNYIYAHIGVGGIHCACCTDYPLSYLKRLINRTMRRKSKSEIKSGVIFNQ